MKMRIIERIKNLFRKEGKISDGYHTFDELYEYRMLYNAGFFNELAKHGNKYNVHKSVAHSDGAYCFGGGWFVVMATLPTGQISNHYEVKYWDLFKVPARDEADEWDGHTPAEAVKRLRQFMDFYYLGCKHYKK